MEDHKAKDMRRSRTAAACIADCHTCKLGQIDLGTMDLGSVAGSPARCRVMSISSWVRFLDRRNATR